MVLKALILSGLIGLLNPTPAKAGSRNLEVVTHTGDKEGFLVNSFLIKQGREGILIDTQFTLSQAKLVVAKIKASQVKLKAIFITHPHPDHYFGLDTITRAFPEAKVYSRPSVIEAIRTTGQSYVDTYRKMFGEKVTDKLVVPTPYEGNTIQVGGRELELIDVDAAESEGSLVFYDRASQSMFTGDLVYSNVHLWLKEKREDAWIEELEGLLKDRPTKFIYPGHGAPGGPALITENIKYIKTFKKLLAESKDKAKIVAGMKKDFPTYELGEIILDISVDAHLTTR